MSKYSPLIKDFLLNINPEYIRLNIYGKINLPKDSKPDRIREINKAIFPGNNEKVIDHLETFIEFA
jgi:hypothetical protein